MSELLFAEVYLRSGNEDAAADNLLQLAQVLTDKEKNWGSDLFSEMKLSASQTDDNQKLLRQTVYDGIQEDQKFAPLAGNKKYQKAIELLKS